MEIPSVLRQTADPFATRVLLRALRVGLGREIGLARAPVVLAVVVKEFPGLISELAHAGDWPRTARAALTRAFEATPDVRGPLLRFAEVARCEDALAALGDEIIEGLDIGDNPDHTFRRQLWLQQIPEEFTRPTRAEVDFTGYIRAVARLQYLDFRAGVRELLFSRIVSAVLHLRAEACWGPHNPWEFTIPIVGQWWARPAAEGFWSTLVTETPGTVLGLHEEVYEFIAGPDATDDDLGHVPGIPELDRLTLVDSPRITDLGLARLWCLLIDELDLGIVPRITDVGLSHLRAISTLRSLSLGGSQRITDDGLNSLSGMQRLETLSIWGCGNVTGTFLREFSYAPGLRTLRLGACPALRLTDLRLWSRWELRTLGLTYCPGVDDAALRELWELTGLESLDLTGNDGITDVGLAHLRRLTGLRWLNLSGCFGVSDGAVERLREALPGCVVERRGSTQLF